MYLCLIQRQDHNSTVIMSHNLTQIATKANYPDFVFLYIMYSLTEKKA